MRRSAVAVLAVIACAPAARAQEPAVRAPDVHGGADRAGPPRQPRPGLERLAEVVERALRLDPRQAARLRGVSARYAARRQTLVAEERAARRTLREELRRDDAADQPRVEAALAALLRAQRQRVALVESEQRELSAFLSPVQRARFLALQERALRAAQRARMQREARGRGGPGAHGGERRPPFR